MSKEINSNIFDAKTENKFKRCQRDFEKLFREYKTDKNQTVFIKCCKENSLLTTAFIEVAKVAFIPEQSTKFVKVKISQTFDKSPDEIYLINDVCKKKILFHANIIKTIL